MSDEITDPEETTTVEEPKKSAATTGNVAAQSKDWEASYKGLQKAYDNLKKKYDKQVEVYDQLSADHEELKQEKAQADKDLAKLNGEQTKFTEEKTTLEGQIASFGTYQDRVRLIMAEFPDLSPFEGKGLLPTAGTVEEMRTKFTEFREAIKSNVSDDVKKAVQGAAPGGGPAGPDGTNGMTPEQVYDRLAILGGKTDEKSREERDSLMKVWLTLNKEPSS